MRDKNIDLRAFSTGATALGNHKNLEEGCEVVASEAVRVKSLKVVTQSGREALAREEKRGTCLK